MLTRRLISSAVAIAGLLLLLWLDYELGRGVGRPGLLVTPLWLGVMVWVGEELRRLLGGDLLRLAPRPVAGAVLLAVGFGSAPIFLPPAAESCPMGVVGWIAAGWVAAGMWAFATQMAAYRAGDQALQKILHMLFIAWVAGLTCFLVHLRGFGGNAWGLVALLSVLASVKLSDSFAYLIGRWLGQRKLSPALSPGKTIEGGIAALLFGLLGAAIVLYPVSWWLTGSIGRATWGKVLAFGLIVTLAGIAGDLAESLLKRESKAKDSGDVIPGMGGLLDVLDSAIGAAPVGYALWLAGWFGPAA